MPHQITIPPPDSGGGSLTVNAPGGPAKVTVTWVPNHELAPRIERKRVDKAEEMRLAIEAMLQAGPDLAE